MDTTAKVDIRKLQLLNDRIAQTIDALNQVRMSVHGLGLSHMSGASVGAGVPGASFGVPFGMQYPQVSPQVFAGWGGVPGLAHSSPYGQQPYAQQPYAQHPFAQQALGQQAYGQHVNPLIAQLYGQQAFGGLSHTSPESAFAGQWPGVGIDPISAARIMQMFPYAQMPISPL